MKQQLLITIAILSVALISTGATNNQENEPHLLAKTDSLQPRLVPTVQPKPVIEEVADDSTVRPSSTPIPVTGGVGGAGYDIPGFNCVVCVLQLTGYTQAGNAGTWRATSSTPAVGKIIIIRPFAQGAGPLGHVEEVVGISGRIVYTAGCNYPGHDWFFDTEEYAG